MKKLDVKKIWKGIKTTGVVMVGIGATAIVTSVVKSTTGGNLRNYERPCVALTTFLAGAMLGDKLVNYVEDQICDVADAIKEAREKAKIDIQVEIGAEREAEPV